MLVLAACSSFASETTTDGPGDAGGAITPPPGADGTAPPPGVAPDGAALEDSGPDAAIDGGSATQLIDTSAITWSSPNGASFTAMGTAVTITNKGATFNHPVVMVTPPLALPDTYTVTATVKVANSSELGLLVRGQPNGDAIVFGTMYGAGGKPFLSVMPASTWNPDFQQVSQATAPIAYMAGERWLLRVRVDGNGVFAKVWKQGQAEPGDQVAAIFNAFVGGSGIGFYNYGNYGHTLEKLTITSP